MFLNEVLVKLPSDPSSDEPIFHISHIDRVYTLKTENINERSVSEFHSFISLISKPLFTAYMGCFMNRSWNVVIGTLYEKGGKKTTAHLAAEITLQE